MFDETNQAEDETGLFDDEPMTDETIDNTSSETTTEEKTEAETSTETKEVEQSTETETKTKEEVTKYKVKHNGKEMDLTLDELITNAQKGIDYDRIRTDRDNLKNAEEIKLFDELARENGMQKQEFLKTFRENIAQQKISTRINELVEIGMSEEIAKHTAKIEYENQQLKAKETEIEQAKRAEEIKKEEQSKEFDLLIKSYPNFAEKYPSYADIPKEVINSINEGLTPLSSYQKYLLDETIKELQKTKEENEIVKQNVKNKEKATGSATSEKSVEQDEFLKEFLN